ncbi:MAG: CotH kinase family protein [Saccharospirillaceae bacterium]|nr:CotH kinase family protein [Pseudomonadales bacterium]NRB80631.1 CotH kinase family protein [Saccharospirillaceae bacterium]
MKQFIFLLFVILVSSCDLKTPASNGLPEAQLMDFFINDEDYIALLGNKRINKEFPVSIKYNNISYNGLIRSSGAASRQNSRWSYRITLNDGQNINGLKVFNLSAQIHDPSFLYTDVASFYYKQAGIPTFEHSHIFLRINGEDKGLKKMIEKIDIDFFEKRQLEVSELYKAGSKISFSFQSDDPNNLPQMSFDKKIPENDNFNTVDQLYYALDLQQIRVSQNSIEQHLDIEQYLKYHAITSFINSADAFENNFFLWKTSPKTPIKFIPWDFDYAFNRASYVGLYGDNAIIRIMLQDQQMFEFYKLELENLINNIDLAADVFSIIDRKALEIQNAYALDPFLGEIYELEQEVNKIKEFLTKREAFFIRALNDFVFTEELPGDNDDVNETQSGMMISY